MGTKGCNSTPIKNPAEEANPRESKNAFVPLDRNVGLDVKAMEASMTLAVEKVSAVVAPRVLDATKSASAKLDKPDTATKTAWTSCSVVTSSTRSAVTFDNVWLLKNAAFEVSPNCADASMDWEASRTNPALELIEATTE